MPKNIKYTDNQAIDAVGNALGSATGNITIQFDSGTNQFNLIAPQGESITGFSLSDTTLTIVTSTGTKSVNLGSLKGDTITATNLNGTILSIITDKGTQAVDLASLVPTQVGDTLTGLSLNSNVLSVITDKGTQTVDLSPLVPTQVGDVTQAELDAEVAARIQGDAALGDRVDSLDSRVEVLEARPQGGGGDVTRAYVDSQDDALDARIDALTASLSASKAVPITVASAQYSDGTLELFKWHRITERSVTVFNYNPDTGGFEEYTEVKPDRYGIWVEQGKTGWGFDPDVNKWGRYDLGMDFIDTRVAFDDLDNFTQDKLSLVTRTPTNGFEIGLNNNATSGVNPFQGIAIGSGNLVNQYLGIAIGIDNQSKNTVDYAMGIRNITGGGRNLAIGIDNKTPAGRAIAIGGNNEANGTYSIAIGEANKANATRQVVISSTPYSAPADAPNTAFLEQLRMFKPGSVLTFTAPNGGLNTVTFDNAGQMLVNGAPFQPGTGGGGTGTTPQTVFQSYSGKYRIQYDGAGNVDEFGVTLVQIVDTLGAAVTLQRGNGGNYVIPYTYAGNIIYVNIADSPGVYLETPPQGTQVNPTLFLPEFIGQFRYNDSGPLDKFIGTGEFLRIAYSPDGYIIDSQFKNQTGGGGGDVTQAYVDSQDTQITNYINSELTGLDERLFALENLPEPNLDGKVDKVAGKQLSTEDFTPAEKSKLAGLRNYSEGNGISIDAQGVISATGGGTQGYDDTALKNRISAVETGKVDKVAGKQLTDVNFTQGDKNKLDSLQNTAPFDDSVLSNRIGAVENRATNLESGKVDKESGSRLITSAEVTKLGNLKNYSAGSNITISPEGIISSIATGGGTTYDDTAIRNRVTTLEGTITTKVDKEAGSRLITSGEIDKLSGLQNYSLPAATSTTLGGVKAGTNISISADGTISSTATGGGTAGDTIATVYLQGNTLTIATDKGDKNVDLSPLRVIADNSITTSKLGNLSVTNPKIADSAVSASKLGTNSVTTAKVQDRSITGNKIAQDSITRDNLTDYIITEDYLNDSAVVTSKIADSNVTLPKLDAYLQQLVADMNFQINRVYFRSEQDDAFNGEPIDRSTSVMRLNLQNLVSEDPAAILQPNGSIRIARAGTYQVNMTTLIRYKDWANRADNLFAYKIGVCQNDPTGIIADSKSFSRYLYFKKNNNLNSWEDYTYSFTRFYPAGTILNPAIYPNSPTATPWPYDYELSLNLKFSLYSI